MTKTQMFLAGFKAMLPIWLGVVPFALAYAVTARASGLSVLETCLMSVLVFAGASQFSAAGMFAHAASGLAIVFTTFLLNIRHLLYGLSLNREIKLSPIQRIISAYFLTDEAFGMVIASQQRNFAFLLGAELSLFFSWNVFTIVGALAGNFVQDPVVLGVDFVFPLCFLALLIPLLKTRTEFIVALFASAIAFVVSKLLPGGLTVLVTGVLGSLLGAWFTRNEKTTAENFSLPDATREVA